MKIVILIECQDKKLRQAIIPEGVDEIIKDCLQLNNGKIQVIDNVIEGVEFK